MVSKSPILTGRVVTSKISLTIFENSLKTIFFHVIFLVPPFSSRPVQGNPTTR